MARGHNPLRYATKDDGTVASVLDLVSDLIEGGKHSRRTVARAFRVSLPTADRWLVEIERRIPGVVSSKLGRIRWYERPREIRTGR
jgi:hypothetical protein